MIVSIGKFGPYVRLKDKFYSLSKNDDPYEVDLERCIDIIKNKRIAEAEKERLRELYPHNIGELDGAPISANIGRYGPYLIYRNENYRLPKHLDPLKLTVGEALAIIETAGEKKPRGRKKKGEN